MVTRPRPVLAFLEAAVTVYALRGRKLQASRPVGLVGLAGAPGALAHGGPPSLSIRSVMQKYLEDRGEVTFEKIFSQKLGEYMRSSGGPEDFPTTVRLPRPGEWGQEDPLRLLSCPPPQPPAPPPSASLRSQGPARVGLLSDGAGQLRAPPHPGWQQGCSGPGSHRASWPLAVGPGSPVKGVGAQ